MSDDQNTDRKDQPAAPENAADKTAETPQQAQPTTRIKLQPASAATAPKPALKPAAAPAAKPAVPSAAATPAQPLQLKPRPAQAPRSQPQPAVRHQATSSEEPSMAALGIDFIAAAVAVTFVILIFIS